MRHKADVNIQSWTVRQERTYRVENVSLLIPQLLLVSFYVVQKQMPVWSVNM